MEGLSIRILLTERNFGEVALFPPCFRSHLTQLIRCETRNKSVVVVMVESVSITECSIILGAGVGDQRQDNERLERIRPREVAWGFQEPMDKDLMTGIFRLEP
jgi:hypothetical protein